MKRIAVVLSVVLVAVMLFAGCGVPQAEVDEQVSVAYDEGEAVGYSDGKTAGYADGHQEVEESLGMTVEEAKLNLDYLATLPEPLHDPTYDELKEFLSVDKTEASRTEEGNCYSHVVYAHLLLNNAKEAGIQGYPVLVIIENLQHLAFAGFETTDKGWIYILSGPPRDREIKLEIGESYCRLNGARPFFPSCLFDDDDSGILDIVILD
jgi:hypothetical protein